MKNIKTQQKKTDILKIIKTNMENIFEQIHEEFINSDEFGIYLKELEIYSEKYLVEQKYLLSLYCNQI